MSGKYRIPAAVLLSLLFVSAAYPAQEQWLQYRTSAEPWRVGISISSQTLQVLTEAPDGLDIPEQPGFHPLYAKWETPMAKDGYLWLVVSRSTEGGNYDRLYADADCDGSLADETAVKPVQASEVWAQFGMVKVVFTGSDGPITYHMNASLRLHAAAEEPTSMVYVSAACWYEGKVKAGDTEYECALLDYDANGAFDDTSMDLAKCDRIRLGGRGAPAKCLGKYIQIGDDLYCPRPARDGAFVTFEQAGDVPMGTVAVGDKISNLSLAGENGQLDFEVKDGKVQAPAGKWIPNSWTLSRDNPRGGQLRLSGTGFPASSTFEVAQGRETALDVGEPVTSRLNVGKNDRQYQFVEMLAGKAGERVSIVATGVQIPAPKLRITNADGSYDRTFQFQYG